jgi:hypothetical protein
MRKITIMLVGSPSFLRIVEHLFCCPCEFEVVGAVSDLGSLGPQSGRPVPKVIVANVKPLSMGIRRLVSAIRQASPSAKVILTCPVEDLAHVARKYGADALLNDEKLAGHLLRTARALSDLPKAVHAGK